MNTDLTLPINADRLIPHRPPMLLVDRLLSYEAGAGTIGACLSADAVLVNSRGELDDVALVEMMAQGYATIKGYDDLLNGRPVQEGFLVGMRKLRLHKKAYAGDRLLINIRTVGTFEGFAVVEGEVLRNTETLVSGSIKLWLAHDGTGNGARP